MRLIRVRGSAAGDGAVIGGIVPDPATLATWAPRLPTYLNRLRVLGAWWGAVSSAPDLEEEVLPPEQVNHESDVVPIRRPR